MHTSRSLLLLTTFLLYLTSFTVAWPWPVDKIFPAVDSLIVRDAFIKRADSTSATASSAATQTPSPSSGASSVVSTDTDSQTAAASTSGSAASGSGASGSAASGSAASGSSDPSGASSPTITATGSSHKNSTTTRKTTSTSISVAENAAAGGLELLIPDTTSGSFFYKITDYVTFAWNYTSLSVTPTAIDVLVTCTSNSQMYTITKNMTVSDNATGAVTWDTNDYPEKTIAPLLTAVYTMYIFDADSSISAEAEAGHLSVFDYSFGMYTKTPYTPFSSWTCSTCSGALSPDERRYLGFMLGMASITVLSFTWFVSGLGVVW